MILGGIKIIKMYVGVKLNLSFTLFLSQDQK